MFTPAALAAGVKRVEENCESNHKIHRGHFDDAVVFRGLQCAGGSPG